MRIQDIDRRRGVGAGFDVVQLSCGELGKNAEIGLAEDRLVKLPRVGKRSRGLGIERKPVQAQKLVRSARRKGIIGPIEQDKSIGEAALLAIDLDEVESEI